MMSQNSVIHLVGSLDRIHGGPSYTVPRLAESVSQAGWHTEIVTQRAPKTSTEGGVSVRSFSSVRLPIPKFEKLCVSGDTKKWLSQQSAQIIHVHGLWSMNLIYAARPPASPTFLLSYLHEECWEKPPCLSVRLKKAF